MNAFIKWLAARPSWFRSKNITTHSVGLAVAGFLIAYNTSPDLRNYISGLFVGYPVIATRVGVILTNAAAGLILWRNFSHSSSAAGTLATARQIYDKPDAPTAKEVDAASVK
jgi:hypothetical protein